MLLVGTNLGRQDFGYTNRGTVFPQEGRRSRDSDKPILDQVGVAGHGELTRGGGYPPSGSPSISWDVLLGGRCLMYVVGRRGWRTMDVSRVGVFPRGDVK